MSRVSFELDNKEYFLPDYISIENYVKVFKMKDVLVDEYFSIKLLNVLSGAPILELSQANYEQIKQLGTYAMALFPRNNQKFVDKFEFEGQKYGFLPNWKDLSFGEFIDLDTLMGKKDNDLLDHIHLITAILYRPIIEENKKGLYKIEKYNSDSMLERAEKFRRLDIKFFMGGQFFFHKFVKKYLEHTLPSSAIKMTKWTQMKMLWKMRKLLWKIAFKKDLDGSQLLIDCQMMMLQDIIKSQNSSWWKRSTSSFSLLRKVMKKKDSTKK